MSVSQGRSPWIAGASSDASAGLSRGCVAKRTCSQTYSDGGRLHHGISLRQLFQFVSSRHSSPTNGTRPPSTIARLVRGNLSNTPWHRIETKWPYIPDPQSVWYSA